MPFSQKEERVETELVEGRAERPATLVLLNEGKET